MVITICKLFHYRFHIGSMAEKSDYSGSLEKRDYQMLCFFLNTTCIMSLPYELTGLGSAFHNLIITALFNSSYGISCRKKFLPFWQLGETTLHYIWLYYKVLLCFLKSFPLRKTHLLRQYGYCSLLLSLLRLHHVLYTEQVYGNTYM